MPPLFSNSQYDEQIRSAVKREWPDFPDWLYWKAQLFQESGLNPDARSPAGATGLAQFMPGTWSDITQQLGIYGVSANQAGPAIEAGAYYMRKLRQEWKSNRPMEERHFLGLASYNAGIGNILKAQDLCHDALLFAAIAPCLGPVTGPAKSHETIDYVAKIREWRRELNF